MATVLLEVALDPASAIDQCGLQDNAVKAEDLSTIIPTQIETVVCSIQASLNASQPTFHLENCSECLSDQQVLAETPYDCEWVTTHLRLPSPTPLADMNSLQDHFLCLPVHVVDDRPVHGLHESPHEKSKCSVAESTEVSNQLRLAALNKYLASIPVFSQHNLFETDLANQGNPHRLITASNSGRVINVIQGEIAHCTPSQADILVSDDATTCHIVALRSICSRNILGKDTVLATMTHLDGPGYETCLRDAVMEHIKHHNKGDLEMNQECTAIEECIENAYSEKNHRRRIDISIHIMGGFNDKGGTSIEITDDILQIFSRMAREFEDYISPPNSFDSLHQKVESFWRTKPRICMKLQTCVVCEANDDGTECPVGRGLAMEVASGKVFLAEVEDNSTNPFKNDMSTVNHQPQFAEGPEALLRSVRLWASSFYSTGSMHKRRLVIIHRADHECFVIEPFLFGPHPSATLLMCMDDSRLRHMTSTSPLVEKNNFSFKVRESLRFMNQTNSRSVFDVINGAYQPIEFRRVGLNGWVTNK